MSADDNRITLTIVSSSGDLEDEFPVNQKIKSLKTSVMGRLNIDPDESEEYQLLYDGDPLASGKTLEELDIPDGAELVLEPEPEVI